MTLFQASLLLGAATLGGALNAIAGGGGFVTFPTLMFIGLPSVNANATSTVASYPGFVASMVAYRSEFFSPGRTALLFSIVSLVGGMLGAFLLLITPVRIFDRLVPYLLLFATLLFTFGGSLINHLKTKLENTNGDARLFLLKVSGLQFLIAVYGGFYGAGMGILMLAVMSLMQMRNLHAMNALKMLLMTCINGFAVVVFISAGIVAWREAAVMITGTVFGGYAGAYLAQRLEQAYVRAVIIVVGFGMTAYFFLRK